MKILPVVLASICLCGFATLPLHADVPTEIKPDIDPKLEALIAAQLVQLVKDMNVDKDNGRQQMKYSEPSIDQIVIGLGDLGRTELALKYDVLAAHNRWEMQADPDSLQPPTETPYRTNIYQSAIYRKVAYGKRGEARALVPLIKTPADRMVPLMWLAASALRDKQHTEALADLKKALKCGGEPAGQHEWLGLLLARAGDTATATQIFNRRQKALEVRKFARPEDPQSSEMFGEGWGSLCTALLRAERTAQGLALVKKHPEAYSTILESYVYAKDSPQRREILNVLAELPNVIRRAEDDQFLTMVPTGAQAAPVAKKRIESLERETLASVARWKIRRQQDEEALDPRNAQFSRIVAAWYWVGQPARAQAFLKRPDLKLNDSRRALIESSALLTIANYRALLNGRHNLLVPDVEFPLPQAQLLGRQLVANFRRLRFDEIKSPEFSEVAGNGVELLLAVGDKASAVAIVRSGARAIERNWRFNIRQNSSFEAEFMAQAARFARIGDLSATKKWMARHERRDPNFSRDLWISIYQSANLMREARAFVDAMPTPRVDPTTGEPSIQPSFWDLGSARVFASAETTFARYAKTPEDRRVALSFFDWSAKLPLEARADLLPEYAQQLSSRSTSPLFNIRNSGFWEVGDLSGAAKANRM